MRAFVLLALASLVLLAAPAQASHMGPCTHEYVEIVLYGVLDYKNGGLKTIAPGVVACATSGIETDGDVTPLLP